MKYTTLILSSISLLAFYACSNNSSTKSLVKEVQETVAKAEYTNSDNPFCLAPQSWFHQVDGKRFTPAPNEGASSVFANNETVSNCDFHQWSWQKFLWLTNDVDGIPLFMSELTQVGSHGIPVVNTDKSTIILKDIAQASGSNDILQVPGNPPTTVYYSIFLNDIFLHTMNNLGQAAVDCPSSVSDATFPVGALELKTSWVDVNAIKENDRNNYFITNGEIDGVKTQVALLGMHVVGVVENHPEFIWATFEHDNLAPEYDWSNATHTTDIPVTVTNSDYLLFEEGATATTENITSGNDIHTNVFYLYKYGVPVEINAQNKKVLMASSQDEPENLNHITSINKRVNNNLQDVWKTYFYNGSIWLNTEGFKGQKAQAKLLNALGNNISSNPGTEPGTKKGYTRGSIAASNITMETYGQISKYNAPSIHEVNIDNIGNCFNCHTAVDYVSNTVTNKSPLYFSHVFKGYLDHLRGNSIHEIKENHIEELVEQFLERSEDEAKK